MIPSQALPFVRVFLGAMALLGLTLASPASAQDVPLQNCPGGYIINVGPYKVDPDEGLYRGSVELKCDTTMIYADEITWDAKTLRAQGNLLVVQDGLRVTADRMEMDRQTKLGVFYNAAGTARLTDKPAVPSLFGTLEPEVSFHAARIERIGPRSYKLTDGSFTTCLQANPRWDVHGSSGTVTLDERVLLRNAVLRVKGVPVIYLPFLYYPLGEDDRSTGLLIPTYSTSSLRGQGISNAFFWAIGRSHDATIYHDWFSQAGQGAGLEYRFISAPGSRGEASFYMLDEKARTLENSSFERPANRSYDLRGRMNQTLGPHFRAIGQVNYITDITSVQLYQQNVFDLSRRDRYFSGAISGRAGRVNLSALVDQRDVYTDVEHAQRRGRLPQVKLWTSEQPLGRSQVYFGLSGEVSGIRNQADISQPLTNTSLWRFDGTPTVRAPLSRLSFLSATASASFRLTHWTESLDPVTGAQSSASITRPMTEIRADVVGPVFARVFQTPNSRFAERLKHVIEPRVSVQWLSAFGRFNEVVKNDPGIDSLVGGSATLTYSLFNRLLVRRRQDGPAGPPELFWVSISQSYYSNRVASAYDTQYQRTTVGQFSAVQVSAATTPTNNIAGRFQMFIDAKTLSPQSYSASMSAHSARTILTAGWSKVRYLPNVPGFDRPDLAVHAVNGSGVLKSAGGRYSGAYAFRLDAKQGTLLEQTFAASFNAQCCGFSVDYQILDVRHIGVGFSKDRRFNFSITLAGIGSFSNPLGSFGR